MGKRLDALRVAFARPKRTNWKAAYEVADMANRRQRELITELRNEDTVLRRQLKISEASLKGLLKERLHKEAVPALKHRDIIADLGLSHQFNSGYEGNAWLCATCGKGTRDIRHKGHAPIQVPTQEASDVAVAIVESLGAGKVAVRTPDERGTDGYYISGRALNFSPKNESRRRAFVHRWSCPKIKSRRIDGTVRVVGDPDYGKGKSRNTIGRWLWGADMKEIRAFAKEHRKYTKMCYCVADETDDADNHNGQIGSRITEEREEV